MCAHYDQKPAKIRQFINNVYQGPAILLTQRAGRQYRACGFSQRILKSTRPTRGGRNGAMSIRRPMAAPCQDRHLRTLQRNTLRVWKIGRIRRMCDAAPRRTVREARIPAGVGEGGRMTVDGSYMAWARPTRRVHLALSVGMTVTGVILIAAGSSGGRSAAQTVPPPALGRAADSVVSGSSGSSGAAGGPVPAAPLVHFAPPVPAPVPMPVDLPGVGTKTHSKPRSHGRHAASVPPPETAPPPAHHLPHPSDLSRLLTPPPHPSSPQLPAHPPQH